MTTASASGRANIPTGRAEVAAAILEAATDLFAERGPAATSIRDIAARSHVNHGLVFRHFGTKENLVGAVLDHLGANLSALLLNPATPADVLDRALDRQMRVMARTRARRVSGGAAAEALSQRRGVARVGAAASRQ